MHDLICLNLTVPENKRKLPLKTAMNMLILLKQRTKELENSRTDGSIRFTEF